MSQSTHFKAGLVQLRSVRDLDSNVRTACDFIREAAASGAHYIQTPENTTTMGLEREALIAKTLPEPGNPYLARFAALAAELKVWLHVGSMGVKVKDDQLANRAFLIRPDGTIAARYDKIHMFDVDLPGGESYRESKRFTPGREAVLADLPWGRIGLTICYDIRFPALYRTLAKGGAQILTAPAAFTKPTGEAHWHVLLRSRAIENLSFMLAAAQGGMHENGRATYGHSIIISPWGEVLAEAGVEPCVITADIDLAKVSEARGRIPSLQHDRPFALAAAARTTLKAAS
ncbi:MAG: carbon-nitrogen hydrolase family protein [Hyphomicrobiaceae bacterium]|nr:MAG: carbon-nitrogen hydrolase family protein [Hyphomicrobiaceae bacterium]